MKCKKESGGIIVLYCAMGGWSSGHPSIIICMLSSYVHWTPTSLSGLHVKLIIGSLYVRDKLKILFIKDHKAKFW